MGVVSGMGTHHRGLLALTTGCVYCQSLTHLFQESFLSICHRHDAGLQGRQRYFRKDPLRWVFRKEIALEWTRDWNPVEARHCSLRASRYQRDSLAQISVITNYWWWPGQFELMNPIHPKLCALWICRGWCYRIELAEQAEKEPEHQRKPGKQTPPASFP